MKLKTAALISAVIMTLSLCGCEKKNSSEGAVYGDAAAFEAEFKKAEDLSEGPLLSLSNTTVKPGGTAEVTISVKNTASSSHFRSKSTGKSRVSQPMSSSTGRKGYVPQFLPVLPKFLVYYCRRTTKATRSREFWSIYTGKSYICSSKQQDFAF
jgi:hypothetical protein